ncbi:zeta toxin family protein [Streptomyces sp. H10-C2]|uniref:zeta toxin family protein n=1 Tax=Streptomyces TaxID=1883 RepID=UPI0018DFA1EF|nr:MULTISPECIES: zeta toxin family protein [Streptomyces]MDJ0344245.1 zeta toxin family protein [Streptomyces sp. PH10-H1]MDJ0373583.1 zeta toxin family protein [Streptomyces sp. H10-C2]
MTDPEAEHYTLSPAESRHAFETGIVPDLLEGRRPQEQPVAVILIGQPGAGKTAVAAMIARQLNARGGFADIDTDLYKPYHPAYAELMARDDRLMTRYIGPAGREWMRQAMEYTRDRRINVLVQDIANDPAASAQAIRDNRAAGFIVEAVALGVSRAASEQGILNRYWEQVKDRGQGRLTLPEKSEASFVGIPVLAETIDAELLAHYEAVYRRGEAKPGFANAQTESGQWRDTPGFAAAIEQARNHPLSPAETWDFLTVQDKLRREMPQEFRAQLDRIDELARPLLHPDVVDRRNTARIAGLGFGRGPVIGGSSADTSVALTPEEPPQRERDEEAER